MNTTKQIELINKVNSDLFLQFGTKHTLIASDDIEKVYGRNVLGISIDDKTRKGLRKG
jgi:hypothetical protein